MTEQIKRQVDGRTVHIVAQRHYTCCECGGGIEKLDVYQHVTGKWEGEGRARYFRTCGHCDEIRDWLFNETDFPGAGGVAGTYVFRGLRKHLLDLSRTGDRAFRIPALRRVVQMNRRRAEARRAPWVKWSSGACPVEPGQLVEVRFRDGSPGRPTPAATLDWAHYGEGTDIISYRRCDPAKAAQ